MESGNFLLASAEPEGNHSPSRPIGQSLTIQAAEVEPPRNDR